MISMKLEHLVVFALVVAASVILGIYVGEKLGVIN